MTKAYPVVLARLAEQLGAGGGRVLVVGGAVRDALLGLPVRDLDLEVFGLPAERLIEIARQDFPLDLVGDSVRRAQAQRTADRPIAAAAGVESRARS